MSADTKVLIHHLAACLNVMTRLSANGDHETQSALDAAFHPASAYLLQHTGRNIAVEAAEQLAARAKAPTRLDTANYRNQTEKQASSFEQELAKQFLAIIATWLPLYCRQEIDVRNERKKHGEVFYGPCASHDFCDATQAMECAWSLLTDEDFDELENGQSESWAKAWDIARVIGFANVS